MAGQEEEEKLGGHRKLWGRTVCFSDCKGDCCSPGGRAISSTRQLAELVANAVKLAEKGKRPGNSHLSGYTDFHQSELADLETGLASAYDLLAPNGGLAVISFHSLEDRIVKQFMNAKAKIEQPDRRFTNPVQLICHSHKCACCRGLNRARKKFWLTHVPARRLCEWHSASRGGGSNGHPH